MRMFVTLRVSRVSMLQSLAAWLLYLGTFVGEIQGEFAFGFTLIDLLGFGYR